MYVHGNGNLPVGSLKNVDLNRHARLLLHFADATTIRMVKDTITGTGVMTSTA